MSAAENVPERGCGVIGCTACAGTPWGTCPTHQDKIEAQAADMLDHWANVVRECRRVKPGTLGYQMCCRPQGHDGPHRCQGYPMHGDWADVEHAPAQFSSQAGLASMHGRIDLRR